MAHRPHFHLHGLIFLFRKQALRYTIFVIIIIFFKFFRNLFFLSCCIDVLRSILLINILIVFFSLLIFLIFCHILLGNYSNCVWSIF